MPYEPDLLLSFLIAFKLTRDKLPVSWSEGSLVPTRKITVNNSPTLPWPRVAIESKKSKPKVELQSEKSKSKIKCEFTK